MVVQSDLMSTFGKLHPTQERLLKTLDEYEGEIPSLRQLGALIGIGSANTIAHHLRQLEAKGYLIPLSEGGYRIVKEPGRDVIYVPLYGNAACGTTEFFADENVQERIPLPARTFRIGPDYFLVTAKGKSMEPKIHDGDLLLVQRQNVAEHGQIVVAALDEGVYAKQLLKGEKTVVLNSFNIGFPPVTVDARKQLRILGLVRGVLKYSLHPNK